MYLSNLAAVLEELEPRASIESCETASPTDPVAADPERPIADESEVLCGTHRRAIVCRRRRRYLAHFRDNYSGDYHLFRIY